MNCVTLGNTGLRCAQVSFGGIPIQRSDAANTMQVVDALERHGINFIDTAQYYRTYPYTLRARVQRRQSSKTGLKRKFPQSEWAGF